MSPTAASHSLPVVILWAGIITGSIDLCAALAVGLVEVAEVLLFEGRRLAFAAAGVDVSALVVHWVPPRV